MSYLIRSNSYLCHIFYKDQCCIIKPLKNEDVIENETVVLSFTISKPRPSVFWYKDEGQTVEDDRVRIRVNDGGFQHSLTIGNASKDDSGEYLVSLDDSAGGVLSTSCNVTVRRCACVAEDDSRKIKVWFYDVIADVVSSGSAEPIIKGNLSHGHYILNIN